MIDVANIEIQARGRWYGILTSLGVPESYLTGKHGPCLFCQGIDRWRWDNKDNRGSYICGQCGSGTAFQLVMKHFGINFKEALKRVNEALGGGYVKMDTVQNNKMSEADIKVMLNKIWTASAPLSGSDPVSKYLHSRGLALTPDNVRYCPECYHRDTKLHYPAMVAKIMNHAGAPISLHRTYLDMDKPQKADIEKTRKLTPGIEPLPGGAIRLFPPKNNTIIVCEGIETGIACAQIFDEGVYACISNTIMEGFEPTEGIRKVIICGDSDAKFAGQVSAFVLAKRLHSEDYIVEVRLPETIGDDFNNVLIEMAK